jgi:hypothetical protein
MFMQAEKFGITEEHIYGTADFTLASAAFLKLFKARMAAAGYGVIPFGGRMSMLPLARQTQIFSANDLAGIAPGALSWGVSGGGTANNDMDQPLSCVVLRLEAGATRRRSLFMAGIPDVIVREDPTGPDVTDYPAWNVAFATYRATLLGDNWGFVNAAPQTPISVVGVGTDPATGNLQLTVSGASAVFAQGAFVAVHKFLRSNTAYASANGRWQIQFVQINAIPVTVTYTLLASAAVNPATITRLGTIQGFDTQFTKYTEVKIRKQGTRKRGNRFLVPPGARRRRVPVSF